MKPQYIAHSFVALGVLHISVMLAVLGPVYAEMLADGWFAAVQHDPLRAAAFWSLLFGGLLAVVGLAIPPEGLPPAAARLFLAVVCTGFIAMPATGFALALPLAVLLWRHAETRGARPCMS